MNSKTNYEVAEMSDSGRFWFKRRYFDRESGKERSVVVSIEEKLLGIWGVRIEDSLSQQIWQLHEMSTNGEEKIVFERNIQRKNGSKSETINLGFVPKWIIEEIKCVCSEMKKRGLDENGRKYLSHLKNFMNTEKKEMSEKLTAKVEETKINGLYKINAETRGDVRGSFREVVRFPEIELLTGYDFIGKQVNHSFSVYGTLRGLHVEPWAKLVTVISGLAVCVFLDCRPKSKTFGKMETIYLGFGTTPDGQEIKGGAIFVETGIANSFMVLSDKMDYSYVVDDLWTPGTATYAINPMDEKLGISWTKYVPEDKIIRSERDMKSPSFTEFCKQRD